MAGRKHDDKDSTGDPFKAVGEKYDHKMTQKVVEEYRKGQQLVTKVTYSELAEKYQIPASTISVTTEKIRQAPCK